MPRLTHALAAAVLTLAAAPAAADDAVASALQAYRDAPGAETREALVAALDAAEAAGVVDRDTADGNLAMARHGSTFQDWGVAARRAKRAMDAYAAAGVGGEPAAEAKILLAGALWRYGEDEPVYQLARSALADLPDEDVFPGPPLVYRARVWATLGYAAVSLEDPDKVAEFEKALLRSDTPFISIPRDPSEPPCLTISEFTKPAPLTEEMLARGESVEAELIFDIETDGTTSNIRLAYASHEDFSLAAAARLEKWRFSVVDERETCRIGRKAVMAYDIEQPEE